MTNTEVVTVIVEMVQDLMTFLLPVIALLSAISFILTFLMAVTMGWGRRTFGG